MCQKCKNLQYLVRTGDRSLPPSCFIPAPNHPPATKQTFLLPSLLASLQLQDQKMAVQRGGVPQRQRPYSFCRTTQVIKQRAPSCPLSFLPLYSLQFSVDRRRRRIRNRNRNTADRGRTHPSRHRARARARSRLPWVYELVLSSFLSLRIRMHR